MKYDSRGNPCWTHQFGSLFSDGARGVCIDGQGRVCVAGVTESDLFGLHAGGGYDGFVVQFIPESGQWVS